MRGMTVLPSQRRMTTHEAIVAYSGFKEPTSRTVPRLFQEYAGATERTALLGRSMQQMLNRSYCREFDPPQLALMRSSAGAQPFEAVQAEMDQALQAYAKELTDRLRGQGFGTITWHEEEACTFDFPEIRVRYGLMTKTIDRVRHVHDLVKARQHRLPAKEVRRPAHVDAVIQQLPAVVHPHLRIITGLEVVRNVQQEGQDVQLHGFGKWLCGAADATRTAAKSVASAVNSKEFRTGAAVVAGIGLLASVATAAAQVALLDPALCLGEIVLCGWENES